jgi:hypothetical protein
MSVFSHARVVAQAGVNLTVIAATVLMYYASFGNIQDLMTCVV